MGLAYSTLTTLEALAYNWIPLAPRELYERISKSPAKLTHIFCDLLCSLGLSTVMIVTLGAPYWQYRRYRCREADSEDASSQVWVETTHELCAWWDAYCILSSTILPPLFPMISSLGLPPCSTASFAATMTFLTGAVSLATSYAYKQSIKTLRCGYSDWLAASQPTWRKVPNKGFWILLSLPAVWFFLSVGLLVSAVVLSVWELPVTGTAASLDNLGCPVERLHAFRYISVITLATTFIHSLFTFSKIHSIV